MDNPEVALTTSRVIYMIVLPSQNIPLIYLGKTINNALDRLGTHISQTIALQTHGYVPGRDKPSNSPFHFRMAHEGISEKNVYIFALEQWSEHEVSLDDWDKISTPAEKSWIKHFDAFFDWPTLCNLHLRRDRINTPPYLDPKDSAHNHPLQCIADVNPYTDPTHDHTNPHLPPPSKRIMEMFIRKLTPASISLFTKHRISSTHVQRKMLDRLLTQQAYQNFDDSTLHDKGNFTNKDILIILYLLQNNKFNPRHTDDCIRTITLALRTELTARKWKDYQQPDRACFQPQWNQLNRRIPFGAIFSHPLLLKRFWPGPLGEYIEPWAGPKPPTPLGPMICNNYVRESDIQKYHDITHNRTQCKCETLRGTIPDTNYFNTDHLVTTDITILHRIYHKWMALEPLLGKGYKYRPTIPIPQRSIEVISEV